MSAVHVLFTPASPGDHRPAARRADHRGMTENNMHRVHRLAALAFMGTVTACLLALVFEQATRGPSGLLGGVVFALAAGFGLEFVSSVWTGRSDGPTRLDPDRGRW